MTFKLDIVMTYLRRYLWVAFLFSLYCQGQQNQRSYFAAIYVGHESKGAGSQNSCAIIGDDGQFHLELWHTNNPSKHNPEVYRGQLPSNLFEQLRILVNDPELVALGNTGLTEKPVANHEVSIVALHLHRVGTTQEIIAIDNDHQNPIPDTVIKFASWMEGLQATAGQPVKDAQPQQCRALDFVAGFVPHLQHR